MLSGCDDGSGLRIWGTDRGAELELREMGGRGSLPLQLQETTLVPAKAWDVPSLLRPGLAVRACALLLSRLCPRQHGQHR